MKRLFAVHDPDGKVYTVEAGGFKAPMYLEKKSKAKEVRDALNVLIGPGYAVSCGPDHHNYKGKK